MKAASYLDYNILKTIRWGAITIFKGLQKIFRILMVAIIFTSTLRNYLFQSMSDIQEQTQTMDPANMTLKERYLSVYLSISIYLSICFYIYLFLYLSIVISIYFYIYLSTYVFTYLYIYLSNYTYTNLSTYL